MMATYRSYSPPRPARIELLEIIYLGRTKARGGSSDRSAVGWMGGRWSVILPEQALRDWFEPGIVADPSQPEKKPTLFMVLMLPGTDASTEDVKAAYRRLVKVTHPDVCRDPDAAEQFKAVQHAYEVLVDPMQRRKYEAGLKLEESLGRQSLPPMGLYGSRYVGSHNGDGYRSPLRSGFVLAEATRNPKWTVVSRILQWTDITDGQGRTMVSSWPMGADEPEVRWV